MVLIVGLYVWPIYGFESIYHSQESRLRNNFASIVQLLYTNKCISATNLIKKTNIKLE